MTAIHSQVPDGGWRRVWHRPRRARWLVERVLAAVRDWRKRRRDRLQIAALDDRISRDLEIYRSDPLNLDREQKEPDACLDTLGFHPFEPRA
jgi:hypothetical protein